MTISNMNIPADWQMKFLGDIGTFSKGTGITKNDLVSDGLPCVRYAELYTKFDFIIPECISFIPEDIAKKSKRIQKGCILFAGSGETKEEIGKCAVYDNDEIAYASGDNIIYTIRDNYPVYLSYYLNTLGRRQLNKLGQGDSIVHIHAEDLKKVKIPLPPLSEQEKIAGILGTWDEAIEKVSDLIEQKKLLKKGLMQKLLTGKTRLSGFTQPWKEVKLGEIAEFILGYSFDSNDFKENGIPLIRISNIEDDKLSLDKDTVFLDTSSLQKYQKYCIKQQDLLIAMSGATTGKMGINKTVTPMLLNQRVGIIRAKKSNQCFINQYLMRFNNKILRMSYGGAQPNIGSNDIKKIKLFIPSDISEQQAIADVLSTADDEIEKLQHKLNLLKLQKKGLMQQLLTGKIRVKINK